MAKYGNPTYERATINGQEVVITKDGNGRPIATEPLYVTPTATEQPLTPAVQSQMQTQVNRVKEQLDDLGKQIEKLARGGDQQVRQQNYDQTVRLLSQFVLDHKRLYIDWMKPKYVRAQ
jgi:hypothetical protein